MKHFRILTLITLFIRNIALAEPVSVKEFGPLSVGAALPSFSGMTGNGVEFGPTKPKAKFNVFFIHEAFPPTCLNNECRIKARYITEQGGNLIGASDGKMAALFGVKVVSVQPWQLSQSILVLVSDHGRILAIYEKVGTEEVDAVIEGYFKK